MVMATLRCTHLPGKTSTSPNPLYTPISMSQVRRGHTAFGTSLGDFTVKALILVTCGAGCAFDSFGRCAGILSGVQARLLRLVFKYTGTRKCSDVCLNL